MFKEAAREGKQLESKVLMQFGEWEGVAKARDKEKPLPETVRSTCLVVVVLLCVDEDPTQLGLVQKLGLVALVSLWRPLQGKRAIPA
jgi:hypothetical protein